jgi:hypothetical protein
MNHLKQIGLALRTYADAHNAFPPAYTVNDEGKPLHSWRTLILPYLEERQLYEKIDLSKPWDDPANAQALRAAPYIYQCPANLNSEETDNRTTYLAVVTPNSCLRPARSRPMSDLTDGLPFTLIVMEVDSDHAVPWMSPFDADEKLVLSIGPESKLVHPGGTHVLYANGSVQFLDTTVPAKLRLAVISIAGDDNPTLEEIK